MYEGAALSAESSGQYVVRGFARVEDPRFYAGRRGIYRVARPLSHPPPRSDVPRRAPPDAYHADSDGL